MANSPKAVNMNFGVGSRQICIYCYREKPGRLLSLKWACYDCKPDIIDLKTDRNPRVITGTHMPPTPTSPLTPAVKAKVQKDGLALLQPLQVEIRELVVTTPEQYEQADQLLTRVREARRRWLGKLSPILDPLAETMKSAKKAMDGAKALLNEADKPLEQLELQVRGAMKTYKIEEARQIREAQDEQALLQQEIAATAAREAAARTAPQRARIAQQRENLEALADAVTLETPAKTIVDNSGTRTKPAWRIKDHAEFLKYVGDGTLPADCVLVNTVKMNAYFKDDPEGMKAWPGIEIFDDITIVAR